MTSRQPTDTSDDLSRAFTLSPIPASVPQVRQWVRRILALWQIAHLRESADLLVTELTTNAIRHARTGGAPVTVLLTYAAGTLRIEVRDRDTVTLPVRRAPDFEEETGRGLLIIEAYADRWSVQLTESGKAVWCELDAFSPSGDLPMTSWPDDVRGRP